VRSYNFVLPEATIDVYVQPIVLSRLPAGAEGGARRRSRVHDGHGPVLRALVLTNL
jgi:hypothetical protein